ERRETERARWRGEEPYSPYQGVGDDPRRRDRAVMGCVSTEELVGAAAFQGLLVRRPGVDAIQEGRKTRVGLAEATSGGGAFEGKAHLDVGRRELGAGEPGGLRQLALEVGEMELQLGVDEGLLHLTGDATDDRA